MDLESRKHWADYSRAKDEMFAVTDTKQAPWFVVNAENKKCARLNVIRHLLSMIPYRDLTPEPLKLPPVGKIEIRAPAHPGTALYPGDLSVEQCAHSHRVFVFAARVGQAPTRAYVLFC